MARVIINFPQHKCIFTHKAELRIGDLNYRNHLGHDTLITLLHEARSKLFLAMGHSEMDIEGAGLVVADLAISYHAEVFYPATLVIEVAFDEPSSKGGDLVYRVTQKEDGTLIALAKTGIVFFDYDSRQAVAMPDAFRNFVADRG